MKRIFTSFLLLTLCFVATWANGSKLDGQAGWLSETELSQPQATRYTILINNPSEGYVSAQYDAGGYDSQIWGGDSYPEGIVIKLNAYAFEADKYEIDYFTVDGNRIEGRTYTLTSDITLSVVFKEKGVEPQPETPTEPEYAVPAPEVNRRSNPSARLVKSITVTGATVDGQDAPFTSVVNSGNAQSEVYKDMTAETLAVTAGDRLHFDINHEIQWMHFYVYIDYNHDGIFDVDNELVAYSYPNGQDSEGNAVEGSTLRLPDFTVKEDAQSVKTRMRIKVDWDNNDPTGNKDPNNLIGNNNGAIYDYTIDIHGVQQFGITINQPTEGGSVMVFDELGLEVLTGAQVTEGSEIYIEATPFDDYELVQVLVNGQPHVGESLIVTDNVEITAEFVSIAEPEYAVPAPEANRRSNPSARLVKSITVTGATVDGQDAPFTSVVNSGNAQSEVYKDMTAETLEATAGDLLHFDIKHQIEWMHFYVYIDYNHDGIFDVDNELVAYSYLNGQDSEGNAVEGSTLRLPDFTVKADAKTMKTRMRIKVDWDNNDPTGNKDPNNTIGNNNGAIYDYTLQLHASNGQTTEGWTVTYDVDKGATLTLEDYGTDRVLQSGDQVANEAFVVASVKVDEGYQLTSFLINDQDRMGDMMINGNNASIALTITENTNIHVGVTKLSTGDPVVTYNFDAEMCEFTVRYKDENGQNVYLNSGDEVPAGSDLNCSVYPVAGYTLASVFVNDQEVEPFHNTWGGDYYVFAVQKVQEDVKIQVNMKADGATNVLTATYTATEGGTVSLKNNTTVLPSGSEFVEGTTLTLYATPDEGYELTSVMVNDEEKVKSCEVLNSGARMLILSKVSESLNIHVTFTAKSTQHTLTYTVSEGGTAKVTLAGVGQVESGTKFDDNVTFIVEMTPAPGYDFDTVLCNGGNMTAAVTHIPFLGCYQLMLRDIKEDLNIEISFVSTSTGIDQVSLADVAYNAATQTINVPEGARAMVYNAAGQLVMSGEGGMLSTASLHSGAYILRVASANAVKVVKFIKK